MMEFFATRLYRRGHSLLPRSIRLRRAIRVAAASAAATALVILGGIGAWRYFNDQRLGRIELSTDGPPLSVQVYDEAGERPIGEPVDLVTKTTLSLREGDYRLRVNGAGRMGRTYRFLVNRGATVDHQLSLDEGRLLGRYPDCAQVDRGQRKATRRADAVPGSGPAHSS